MNPPPAADASRKEGAARPFAVPLTVSLVVTAALIGASSWAWRQLPAEARIPDNTSGKYLEKAPSGAFSIPMFSLTKGTIRYKL